MNDEVDGQVTRVGTDNIQFYIPKRVSSDDACVFDPEDDFAIETLDGLGLLITPPDVDPTLADLLEAVDIEPDERMETIDLEQQL